MGMKAALYPRVSTEEQSKEGYSLNAQLEKMRAFCFSQGWTIYKEYVEEGKSAKNMERPKLQELLSEMQYFDVIVVYKLDRLSRNVSDINILLNTFEKNKVAFKSVTEPYDTTTAQGKLLINIFASLAQFEREQLSERTHMGMSRKHEEGSRNGGRAPFGYEFDLDNELVINDEEAKWVRWIFENFKTKGKTTVAKELNRHGVRTKRGHLWTDAMVNYIVCNPVYYGMLRWNYRNKQGARTYEEILTPGKHEPIISQSLFESVQTARKKRKVTKSKGNAHYPFTGILICKRCGHKMYGGRRKKADGSYYRFYNCTGRFSFGVCDMPVIAEDTIEEEFLKVLSAVPTDLDVVEEEQEDPKAIEREIKKVRARMNNWKELFVDGDLTKKEYKEKMDLEQEKETALMQSLQNTSSITPDDLHSLALNLKDTWPEISLEVRKAAIQAIIQSIKIECLSSHKGGSGARPVIQLSDVSYSL